MGTGHLLRTLLPYDSVALGRLVKNANRPHQDYIDPLPPRPHPNEVQTNHQKELSETRKFSKGSSLRFNLGDLIELAYTGRNGSTATLTAPDATSYDLSNSDYWFRDACKQEGNCRWLEEAIDKDQNVYLVIGFRTAHNAKLRSAVDAEGVSRLRSSGPPIPSNSPVVNVNPAGEGTQSHDRETSLKFDAPGEQVFAVIYRKVKFSWLSSRKTANMKLEEGNRWKSVWDWRGPDEEVSDGEDDVLEAELTDSSDLDDDEEYNIEEEDDGFGDGDVAPMPTQAGVIPGTGSDGPLDPQVEYASGAVGGVDGVTCSKVLEVESGQKSSGSGISRVLILWGIMLLLFLLFCQWFFELKSVIYYWNL